MTFFCFNEAFWWRVQVLDTKVTLIREDPWDLGNLWLNLRWLEEVLLWTCFNRVFHYFHHPFWVPLFLETPIYPIIWWWSTIIVSKNGDLLAVIFKKKNPCLLLESFPIRKKTGSTYPTNQHPNLCKVQNDVLQSARARYPRREYLAFQTPRESKKIPDWNYYPPGKLTWNLNITQLKRKIILQTFIIVFHVNFQGCTPLKLLRSKYATWAEFLRRLFGSPMIGSMMMVLLSWHTRESMNIKVDEQGSLLSLSHSLWNHPQITKE